MAGAAPRRHHDRGARALPAAVRPVAGVDGCRAGWVVALATKGGIEVSVVDTFAEVLTVDAEVIAVDMPIGLPDAGTRACDVEARRALGPRRASVFPTPVRAVLAADDYRHALALSRAVDGRGLSAQAWNLVPKLREVDAEMTPAQQDRVVEASPELSFAVLLGAPCTEPKRTAAGRAARRAAVAYDRPAPRGAAEHDLLDAVALTVTATRVAAGRAVRYGDGARDATGLRMEICQ